MYMYSTLCASTSKQDIILHRPSCGMSIFINPRCACTVMATVVVLCVCVCLSVSLHAILAVHAIISKTKDTIVLSIEFEAII